MSTLKADTIQSTGGGAATLTKQSAAKAFYSLNGTGTIAFRKSLNCSSASDLGTGDYKVFYSNAMSDADYSAVGNFGTSDNNWNNALGSDLVMGGNVAGSYTAFYATTGIGFANFGDEDTGVMDDVEICNGVINGDLA
jgi:hypothetical protein